MVTICDNSGRLIATVDAGTNGGTAWTRPSTAPAASSPTLLVTKYVYNAAGEVQDTIDPMGIKDRTLYDNLGRTTETIQDYTDGTETADSNIITQYGYDGDNHVIYVRADEPGGAYQQTDYLYGVSTAHASWINSNDILGAIEYPDPTTGQPSAAQEEYYHVTALGQPTQYIDRNGTLHGYGYDTLGRLIYDEIRTFGASVDNSTTGIGYDYNSQGNLSQVITSGSTPTTVEFVYNGLGQLTGDYQAHNGGVTGSTPEVQYAYSEMANGENNSRLVSMTYPDGYTLNYNYNNGLDDRISRLSSISDASNTLEAYKYLGLGTVVERDHPQINVNQTFLSQNSQTGDAGDPIVGLDRFGRVVNDNWYNTSTATSTDDFQYGYDEDSNVLYKQNLIDTAMSEFYQYNNLDELISFARGTLNSSDNGIVGTPSASQSWAPDALGNFDSVTTNGVTQTRTANQQNEITSISGQGAPTYDANGNLTADGTGNTYVYDAWNRLISVSNNGTLLASYGYDGLGRRITVMENDTTTDLYYSTADQVVEEDVGGVAQARNVWSPVYVNAMILRDQSSQHNGVLDQRLYVQQDANWNVTAIVNTASSVVERYDYLPYGSVTVLNPSWTLIVESAYNVPLGFQGMQYDWLVAVNLSMTRVYKPALDRWLQVDPTGLNAGTNVYEFVKDRPVGSVDPSGLDIIVLYDTDAAHHNGHMAILIGSEKDGWVYRSFVPERQLPVAAGRVVSRRFATLARAETDPEIKRYTKFIRYKTTRAQDLKAIRRSGLWSTGQWRATGNQNCVNFTGDILKAAGVPFTVVKISISRAAFRTGARIGVNDIGGGIFDDGRPLKGVRLIGGYLTGLAIGTAGFIVTSGSIGWSYITDEAAVTDPGATYDKNKDQGAEHGSWEEYHNK